MQERREVILDAFEKLAARYGLSKTTIKDVAREAGISVGAVYLNYADKEALIFAFWQREVARCIRRLDELAAQDLPPEALLRRLVLGHIRDHNEQLRGNLAVYELTMESAISYIGRKILGQRQIVQQALTDRVEKIILAGAGCGAFEVTGDARATALRFVEAFTEYSAPPLVMAREPEEVLRDAESMFSFVVRALRRSSAAGNSTDTEGEG